MAEGVVSNGYIRDLAERAETGTRRAGLVHRRDHDAVAVLAKPAPGIFHDVGFQQDALGILQLEEILDDKRIPGWASHQARLALHPGHRLEEVVAADLNIGRGNRAGAAAEENVFA